MAGLLFRCVRNCDKSLQFFPILVLVYFIFRAPMDNSSTLSEPEIRPTLSSFIKENYMTSRTVLCSNIDKLSVIDTATCHAVGGN